MGFWKLKDKTVWHRTNCLPFFKKTISGRDVSGFGQVWRRWRNERWEYQQDEEAEDEFWHRQY